MLTIQCMFLGAEFCYWKSFLGMPKRLFYTTPAPRGARLARRPLGRLF